MSWVLDMVARPFLIVGSLFFLLGLKLSSDKQRDVIVAVFRDAITNAIKDFDK
jgi:hypothetical protein